MAAEDELVGGAEAARLAATAMAAAAAAALAVEGSATWAATAAAAEAELASATAAAAAEAVASAVASAATASRAAAARAASIVVCEDKSLDAAAPAATFWPCDREGLGPAARFRVGGTIGEGGSYPRLRSDTRDACWLDAEEVDGAALEDEAELELLRTGSVDELLRAVLRVEARGGRPALAGIVVKLLRMEENADVMDAEGAAERRDGAFALEAGAGTRKTGVALELPAAVEAEAPPSRICSASASS